MLGAPLKTEPQFLLTLLQLQQADLTLERLSARRQALPETRRAKELAVEAAAARDRAVMRRTEASDLQREVRKLDDEVDKVRARAKRDADLLASGTVVAARQLSELQHEIGSLERRQSDLEDAELELMEQVEQAERAQLQAESDRDQRAAAAQQSAADASAALAALTAEQREVEQRRGALAAEVPEDLLALYERIRSGHGGIAAAEFAGDQCGACRLQMIPAELAEVKTAPVDDVVRCEECGRILVRTELLRS